MLSRKTKPQSESSFRKTLLTTETYIFLRKNRICLLKEEKQLPFIFIKLDLASHIYLVLLIVFASSSVYSTYCVKIKAICASSCK